MFAFFQGGYYMIEVECDGLLEGKTVKCGDILIIGTKPVKENTTEQAS